ncbi:MAG: STAS domain-containing protein [Methanospirillaceae archaeon]|nr:STAS domain-containing protein [Methanospirillaceae archaeon]
MDDAAFFHSIRKEVTEKTLPIDVVCYRDVWIFAPEGRIDNDSSTDLEATIMEGISQGMHRIVIDFSFVPYISSSGLRVVIKIAKALQKVQGRCALSSLSGTVRQVFELSGFLTVISSYDSVDEAVTAIR